MFIGASKPARRVRVAAAWFGAVSAVVLGGVGTLAVVALWAKLFPALFRYDRLDRARPSGSLTSSDRSAMG
jgi:hypothetical protein